MHPFRLDPHTSGGIRLDMPCSLRRIEQIMNIQSRALDAKLLAGVRAAPAGTPRFGLGAASIDARLKGGLPCGALHEVFAFAGEDCAAAEAFALLLALRQPAGQASVIWIRAAATRHLVPCPQGLADLGADVGSITLVEGANARAVLRAAADSLRSKGLAAVIVTLSGNPGVLDLTASRRLALASGKSGVPAFLVRIEAEQQPSAAYSRWRVKSAASQPLEANAPGGPAFDVALLRHRGGVAPFDARLEWDHVRKCFADAPLPCARPAAAALGTAGSGARRAA